MKTLTAAAVLAAVLASGCSDGSNTGGSNQSCTSNCFSLNGIGNDDAKTVDEKIENVRRDGKEGHAGDTNKDEDNDFRLLPGIARPAKGGDAARRGATEERHTVSDDAAPHLCAFKAA